MCETASSSWAMLITSAEKMCSSISLSPGLKPMEGMKISQMSTLTDMVFPMALYKETRVQMRQISDLD
jgi:hypothetical protein